VQVDFFLYFIFTRIDLALTLFFSGTNKITINLCDDSTLQLLEFVSWQCTAADGFIFIF